MSQTQLDREPDAAAPTPADREAKRQARETRRIARGRKLGPWGTLAVWAFVVVSSVWMFAVPDLDRGLVGLTVMFITIALMLLGMPIAIAMFGASILGLLKLGGMNMLAATFRETIYGGAASWELSVIPLFVFMGIVMWRSGLTGSMFESARLWLGKLPGGLAVGTNFAGAGLAASSGSSIGISYALGRVAIPEMLRAGYSPSLATGVVAMAGTLGQLIPPSIMLVIYAGIAQTPVGPQLVAAIIPGILIAVAFGVMIMIRAIVTPSIAPRYNPPGITWKARFASLTKTVPVLLIVVVVIGGLLGGFFTATEAGACGALAAVLAGWLLGGKENRKLRVIGKMLWTSLKDTAAATAGIFLLLIAVAVLSRVMALSQLATELSNAVIDLGLSRVALLLILMVVYVILGTFLEPLAMMLLTLPVLIAPLAAANVDLIWFGIFIVVMAEIAVVSPPVGMLAFIVFRLAQNKEVNLGKRITLSDVFNGVIWFVVVALLVVVLLIFFPEIVTWLPSLGL